MEIPLRLADKRKPTPVLKEIVTMQGTIGTFEIFRGLPILHGFSWENPQNLSYSREPGYPEEKALQAVRGRIVEFLNSMKIDGSSAVLAQAIPGQTGIVDITDTSILEDHGIQGRFTPEGNASFTTIPGLPLYTTMGDCTQTIFYCERKGLPPVVGLIHAGRTEVDKQFPMAAIRHAIERYGLDPEEIKLGIAPSLEPSHHEIQANDYSKIITNSEAWQPYILHPTQDGPYYVDVRSNLADQYMTMGVLPENIELYLTGTYDSAGKNRGFSHRRSRHENSPLYRFGMAVQIT